jgi:two-component system CheB/CheR fusion protein
MVALQTGIHEASGSGQPVRKPGVRFRTNGDFKQVDLHAIPMHNPGTAGDRYFLVLFENLQDVTANPVAAPPLATPAPPAAGDGETVRLREELTATKEYLQSIIESQEAFNEELRSANEEILSSNEELQSTNEELETAKEELQSTNEELATTNDELRIRNRELNELNAALGASRDYADAIIETLREPLLILDSELRVMRANTAFYACFQTTPADTEQVLL